MKRHVIKVTLYQIVYILYFHVFTEWLFFSTKLSFMGVLSTGEKIKLIFTGVLPFLCAGLLAAAPLLGVYYALQSLVDTFEGRGLSSFPRVIAALVPAFLLTVVSVILIDNFTYTMFKWGIVRTSGAVRVVYLLCSVFLFAFYTWRFFLSHAKEEAPFILTVKKAGAVLLPAVTVVILLMKLFSGPAVEVKIQGKERKDLPNIIFFASDGIQAVNLSAYGYYRKTTPVLDRFVKKSLFCRNAVTNVPRTTGATVAMLTGKYPATTKVFFPPHTLTGNDAFQHLPGILRRQGYVSLQETARYYADGPDLNMLNAFDEANRRKVTGDQLKLMGITVSRNLSTDYHFVKRMTGRVRERTYHLLGIEKMVDVFALATQKIPPAKVYGFSDRDRIERAIRFMKKARGPFFAHIHLMESHCGLYNPRIKKWSARHRRQNRRTWNDFYDDIILSSDAYFGELVSWLEKSGKMKNTVIVYYSDHTQYWRYNKTVPLIFIFPGGKPKGQIHKTVQLMDAAPTILDYLDIKIPEWMEGYSLLRADEIDLRRPVYSVAHISRTRFKSDKDWLSKIVGEGPPLYGLEFFSATVCDRIYKMNVKTGKIKIGKMGGHLDRCRKDILPSKVEVKQMIYKHLTDRGFTLPFEN